MNKFALLPAADRRDVFTETGARLGLPPFHVEKDFWVCWVLSVLFGDADAGPNLTFRGGTSLSKAWGIIERFSEDIDLAMSRDWLGEARDAAEEGISTAERDRRLGELRGECRTMISEELVPILRRAADALSEPYRLEVEPLEKARDPFCLHFEFPGTGLVPPAAYNKAAVKIELSGRADGWPMENRTIVPYVGQVFPRETGDPKFLLSCVRPERTFWEKAALVHEQNVRSGERQLAPRQARHLSDLVRLWDAGVFEMEGFLSLFKGVKEHRNTYFDYKWVNYDSLEPRTLRIVPPAERLAGWRADYEAMREMFFSDPLSFEELIEGLHSIEEYLRRL